MAKSASERKAAQRARQSAAGERKIELVLDSQELDMLERNCAARRPGRAPYEMGEYIAMLIRQDFVDVSNQSAQINVENAATRCRLHHAHVQVILSAGLRLDGMR